MTDGDSPKIGAILLAAGGSSRLGRPKQLVEFQGKTLIRRASEMLVASVCSPVVVVLGAEIARCSDELAGLDISICVNENWNDGISSSIKTGLRYLLTLQPDLAAAVIALCDQPHLSTNNIDRLIAEFQLTKSPTVVAEYEGITGVPALFSKELFGDLYQLRGDKGARDLIRLRDDVVSVSMAVAAIDIDKPSDIVRHISE